MFGMKRKAKVLRETSVAGATNTGNVTATVGNKQVLNWHGTSTHRDDALKLFPIIRDKMMPGVELGEFADGIIKSIHDGVQPANQFGSNWHWQTGKARALATRLEDQAAWRYSPRSVALRLW